jgi:poly-gamma-glutamate synthesis protein (capsule biosynthesis protein)
MEGKSILSIAFVGDIMWIRNGWDSFLDEKLRLYLMQFDMVFGNLETPIDTARGVKSLLPDYATYNSDPGLIRSFRRDDGSNIFTALSVANNHAFDMGAAGILNTTNFLRGEGISTTGASLPGNEAPDYITIMKNGVKTGFYSTGWGLNEPEVLTEGILSMNIVPGIAPMNEAEIDISDITKVLDAMEADTVDFRIIFLHWGYEYEMMPDPAIIRLARKIAEAGADVVIGSHPHVVQPSEVWRYAGKEVGSSGKNRTSLIAYSLGNFTTAMYTPECRLGIIMSINIIYNDDTGRYEWSDRRSQLVYNAPRGAMCKSRRLMLYEDFLESLRVQSPRRADKINESLSPIIKLIE